jgi:hypothetical protein
VCKCCMILYYLFYQHQICVQFPIILTKLS